MGDRIEIRLHGRGGQGTVTLAALIVDAAFRSGWHALGFPAFGTERTGAPVEAYARLSREPILDRAAVRHPGIVVVQDPTLIGIVDIAAGLRSGGTVVLNAAAAPEALASAGRVVTVAATDLAREHLGSTITSTAMLGAFAAATGLVGIEEACAAIADRFGGQVARRNEATARAAFGALGGREAA